MTDLENRVADLERRLAAIEPTVRRQMPLGPRVLTAEEERSRADELKTVVARAVEQIKEAVPPVDRDRQQLVSGQPVPEDRSHTELKPNGQQQDYVVLTPEERAKGFVRPVRTSYRHVGAPPPKNPLRDLTPDEVKRWGSTGYVKFEEYPGEKDICNGRFWMQNQLDAVGHGCGTVTTMSQALAETYARDPKFYGGTFCCGCAKHLPVDEFVWNGTDERVGS